MRSRVCTPRSPFIVAAFLLALSIVAAACSGPGTREDTASTRQAVTSTVTISGQTRNAAGAALAGVTVHLAGATNATQTTSSNGDYSFAGLAPGSYVLQVNLAGCLFLPAIANLNNITANTTQNFDGAGSTCGGQRQAILTISGTIENATGLPLPGVIVQLVGPSPSVQTTGPAGTFSFSNALPGSYLVQPLLLGCNIPTADLDNLTDSITVSLGGSGTSCAGPSPGPITISGQARNAQGAPLAGATISVLGPSLPPSVNTGANGNYTFSGLTPGSYVVAANLPGCAFTPPLVNLNNLNASTIQNFDGSGLTCGGLPSGVLTVSGQINDANGMPLPGVRVQLIGSIQPPQTTGSNGTFAFPNLVPGSYTVQPLLAQCSFNPQQIVLNNLTDSATELFSGSGPTCGGAPTVNAGATAGPLTIFGHVTDSSGHPIAGAQIALNGTAQATRFSDLTGAYTFQVSPGSYSLTPSAACALSPQLALANLSANFVQNFTATTHGCSIAVPSSVVSTGEVIVLSQGGTVLGTTFVKLEQYQTSSTALARLTQISAATTIATTSLTIAGYPAIERQMTVPLNVAVNDPGGMIGGPSTLISLSSAIAVGSTVVHFESLLPSTATSSTINSFFALDRDFTPQEIPAMHGGPPQNAPRAVPALPMTPPVATPPAVPGAFVAAAPGVGGEISVAASDATNTVIYGSNFNGGSVFVSAGGAVTQTPLPFLGGVTQGDPSVAVGAPNPSGVQVGQQAFYFSEVVSSSPTTSKLVVLQSKDDGQTFVLQGTTLDCNTAAPPCALPDQPMLAVDRFTQAGSGDELYMTWRQIGGPMAFALGASCSFDGGQTWQPPNYTGLSGAGNDFPRLSVERDGSVIVLFESPISPANLDPININVQKFTRCDLGFQPIFDSLPTTINPTFPSSPTSRPVHLIAPLPGLDRYTFAHYMVAPDYGDPTSQRVFAAFVDERSFASSFATGNADISLAESRDGGTTWTIAPFAINHVSKGQRFHPWICTSEEAPGTAFVTWYDRRDQTAASPDLTAHYMSSVTDSNGILVANAEFNVSGVDDPECLAGFPQGVQTFAPPGESNCTDLPPPPSLVAAGTCQSACAAGVMGLCGSGTPCDYRSGSAPCPAGETCQPTGGGVPTYGDYNGNACAHGGVFMAWAAATPPMGFSCIVDGVACQFNNSCCSQNCVGGVCAPPGAANCVANGGGCQNVNGAGNNCCSGNCEGEPVLFGGGGQCLADIGLYTDSASCTSTPCANIPVDPVRAVSVGLSGISYWTTGGNLFNCGAPVGGANQHINNGNATIICAPVLNTDGSLSTTPQHVQQEVGSCGDNHPAWVDVTCFGTGARGNLAISGTVEMSLGNSCGSDTDPDGNGNVLNFEQLVPGTPQDLGGTGACDTFSNACASGACTFNAFLAGDITVTNSAM